MHHGPASRQVHFLYMRNKLRVGLLPFLFTEHVVSHPERSCTAGRHSQTDGPISFAMRCPGIYH